MLEGPGKDGGDYYRFFESAIVTYQSKCSASIYAVRATVFATEMLAAKGRYKEAGDAFQRMADQESDLRTAILCEQTAECYLRQQPPAKRKAAFQLILAGYNYNRAHVPQRHHGLRCYLKALALHRGLGWRLAEDHLNLTVAQRCQNLGMHARAVSVLCEVLQGSPQQAPVQQRGYLQEYLTSSRLLAGHLNPKLDALLNDNEDACMRIKQCLPVPCVHAAGITVQLQASNNQSTMLSGELAQVADVNWKAIQSELAEHLGTAYVELPESLNQSTNNTKRPLAVVKETVFILTTLRNPLHVPLQLTNVRLICTLDPESKTIPPVSLPEAADIGNYVALRDQGDQADVVELTSLVEVALGADKELPVALTIIPLRTGFLKIHGLQFDLSWGGGESIHGCTVFELQGPRLNKKPEHKAGKVYGPDRRLEPEIVSAMPRLELQLNGLKSTLVEDEITSFEVVVTNKGSTAAVRLVLTSKVDGLLALQQSKSGGNPVIIKHPVDVTLPEGGIAPGESLTLQCWLQPRHSGSRVLQIAAGYQAGESDGKLGFRTSKQTALLDVQPGLRMLITLYPDPFDLDKAYLAVRCRCAGQAQAHLGALELISEDWQWDAGQASTALQTLSQGQHQLATFHLSRHDGAGRTSSQLQLNRDVAWKHTTAVYDTFANLRVDSLPNNNRPTHTVRLTWTEPGGSGTVEQALVHAACQMQAASDWQVAMNHPTRVEHDFLSTPLCRQRVTLSFSMLIPETRVWCKCPPDPKSGLKWIGKTSCVVHASSEGTAMAEFTVACAQPGVFDLSGIALATTTPGANTATRVLTDERLLVIDQAQL
eukprot:TRINITY_DN10272_c0_g2_i2.p1 TRINITY_DN10272_c0_g2~~TRINITY_DN10272_c0_g2_i2.p1  ORF type:complete len:824 (+),score=169.13 TRINITY_DN10272_c0_g2_i2:1-2472(+)